MGALPGGRPAPGGGELGTGGVGAGQPPASTPAWEPLSRGGAARSRVECEAGPPPAPDRKLGSRDFNLAVGLVNEVLGCRRSKAREAPPHEAATYFGKTTPISCPGCTEATLLSVNTSR